MSGWQHHSGKAVLLARENVDTDQLIPARFMSVPRSEGYGAYLLHDLRRDENGALSEGFPLNTCDDASILIAGRNFGSGSSREAAVYALVDAGFRAVIAPSFGDIFASNAVNNGLLPAAVSEETYQTLTSALRARPQMLEIDVGQRRIALGEHSLGFTLEDSWALKLVNGWDDIDLTRAHRQEITAFRDQRHQSASWAWPEAAG